jgi:methionine synthase II (cobalamin-independent)
MISMCIRVTVSLSTPFTLIFQEHSPTTLLENYFDDIGIAYRQEIKELYDLGCRMSNL